MINIKNKPLKLILSILVCQLAGIIGSIFTIESVNTWYKQINQPFFTPPSWIFSPVWITLYAMMGISLYLIWSYDTDKSSDKKLIKAGYIFFFIQLGLNSLWSILFFGLKSPLYAFIEIIILWSMIMLTIFTFYRIKKASAYLLVPYLLWVSFAGILNLYFVILN